MWQIGDVTIDNPVVLAPMAGICNSAFRVIVKEFGVGLLTCEMVSDKGIHYRNRKTLDMLEIKKEEHPISLQIFGGDVDTLVEAAQFVESNTAADIIDINMGCPVNKVIKANAGSKWLLDPDRLYETVRKVVESVNIPVTVKMRIGWDDDHIFAVENAKAAENAGVKAIAMHGRTREQMYEGKANWEILRQVREVVTVPFIGNGDVNSPEKAKQMIDEVGVNAVMIGRAALGNPWVIYRTVKYLDTGELLPAPTPSEKIKIAEEHLERLIDLKGESLGVREFRQHASYYVKGLPNAGKVKVVINQTSTFGDMKQLLDDYVIALDK